MTCRTRPAKTLALFLSLHLVTAGYVLKKPKVHEGDVSSKSDVVGAVCTTAQ